MAQMAALRCRMRDIIHRPYQTHDAGACEPWDWALHHELARSADSRFLKIAALEAKRVAAGKPSLSRMSGNG